MVEKAYQRIVAFLLAFAVFVTAMPAYAISLISDAETEIFLHRTLIPIFEAAGVTFNPRHIYIVNDKSLNAFVADGNNMFVTVGTLMAADSQNEVSGVLAHETGHIAGGHILRHKIQAREIQRISLLSMLLGGAAGIAAGRPDVSIAAILGSQGSAMGSLLAYQVSEERSADEAAVKLLAKINQSPSGMLSFMKKIQKQNTIQGIEENSYFRTHPVTSERITFLEKAVRESKSSTKGKQEEQFKRIKAKLYAFIEDPKNTLIKYPENDDSVAARYARTIAYFKKSDMPKALSLIDGLIADESANPYFWELKGQMLLETGQVGAAADIYRQALKLQPDSSLFKLNLAQAMLENSPSRAEQQQIVDLLNQVLIYNPDSSAWLLLARAYGLQENAAGYNYAAAEYSLRIGDVKLAEQQAKQAVKSNPGAVLRLKLDDLLLRIKDYQKDHKYNYK